MGWLHSYPSCGETAKDLILGDLDTENYKIIDYSISHHEAYLAIKNLKTNEVRAEVTLISRLKGSIGIKRISDTSGPCYYACPQRILKKLSPPPNAWAKTWMEQCWAYHEAQCENRREKRRWKYQKEQRLQKRRKLCP